MIIDSCPNCNGELSLFDFSCGSDISKECICLSCDYCSYIFTDDKMVGKIKDLLLHPKKAYSSQNGRVVEITQKFIVTCNDEIIENHVRDNKDAENENTILLRKAPSVEEIQEQINKKYTLELNNIIGFDDIKRLLRQVINIKNKKRVHLLIGGHPGTGKTVFLLSAKDELEPQGLKCDYLDCSNLTGAGLLDHILTIYVNENRKIDVLLLDEIDKTDIDDQKKFLNVLQTGIAKNTKRYDKRSAQVSITAIATANDIHKIYKPLLDRFTSVYIPKYTKEQFFNIGDIILKKKYNLSQYVRQTLLLKLWQVDGSMRRVDDLGILIKDEPTDSIKIEKFQDIINTLISRTIPKTD